MSNRFDTVGALCEANAVAIKGNDHGPLAGLDFVVKDVFDIAGVETGFGHPDWLTTHALPQKTASAVQLLLDAGADLIGKAHSDELCYSLSGENIHYGTPINVAAPGCIPGGSSNGSAAAVAAGLCDFALGTDCGGSVRIPASYCGLLGLRPTWGRVEADGVVDFAPSFDVVGWFARDGQMMRRIGDVLLPEQGETTQANTLLMAMDAFAGVSPDTGEALAPTVKKVATHFGETRDVTVSPDGLESWFQTFRTIQAFEVWRRLGAWLQKVKPKLGPGVADRLAWAATVTPRMYNEALEQRSQIRTRLDDLLPPGSVLCLPTSPRPAPLRDMPANTIEIEYRAQAMRILCIAGLCGLPQISLPLATLNGLPLGLSLVGPHNSDDDLLAIAEKLCPSV